MDSVRLNRDKVACTIEVDAQTYARVDYIAEVALDSVPAGAHVIEVDDQGNVIDAAVPFQLDDCTLTFMLTGTTAAHSTRRFQLAAGQPQKPTAAQIHLTDGVMHQAQESFRIETNSATYLFHKFGAGFASMIDPEGNDWLSYRPYGGSDGRYRGIPNLAYPENHFHPGGTGCTSRVISSGPLKLTIAAESRDGEWACTWDIYPTCARLTVLKVGHPYWFLYEGTPGGQLDEAGDYCVRSDGARLPLTECWALPLPAPEWIYFGAANTPRVLYLLHHEADDLIDSFWPMEHNMTVFGFGRNNTEKYMTQTPAHFTIGFADDGVYATVQETLNSILHPLKITVQREV